MPYGNVPFQNELDAAVLSNKPINSIASHGCSPWPDVESLIGQCLLANPGEFALRSALVKLVSRSCFYCPLLQLEFLFLVFTTTSCQRCNTFCFVMYFPNLIHSGIFSSAFSTMHDILTFFFFFSLSKKTYCSCCL